MSAATAPNTSPRARRHRAEHVAACQAQPCGLLELGRDRLVRRRPRLAEVPRATFGLAGEGAGECLVHGPAVRRESPRHRGGADQGVLEGQPAGKPRDPHQAGALGDSEVDEDGPARGSLDGGEVARAVEGRDQQQLPGRGGQIGHACGEHFLEALAEGQLRRHRSA
ncbi:hypothetical protein [Streptomyces sp. E5N91]|uniref:hypothetical protein n=1 Tax=Streptomyces sp. E5N91 TaxID=1851996 RepID=UPI001EE8078A|nr:hypothetical protein [Streptomyces sp. E5N91]